MAEEQLNQIPTGRLFDHINAKRRKELEPVLENALLASKLGILIAVKTDSYANFRQEYVGLTDQQLSVLSPVLEEFFNVHFAQEDIMALVSDETFLSDDSPELLDLGVASHKDKPRKAGFFGRLKGFFSRKKRS